MQCGKDENKQKEAGIGPFFKNRDNLKAKRNDFFEFLHFGQKKLFPVFWLSCATKTLGSSLFKYVQS